MSVLAQAAELRTSYLDTVTTETQEENSQYFTPIEVATLMADIFDLPEIGTLKVLDPGAGSGILTAALVERVKKERPNLTLEITAIEKDPALIGVLSDVLEPAQIEGHRVTIINDDFITWALKTEERFDFVIQNPPYKKLKAHSPTDLLLKEQDIQVPNLYAAFMKLGTNLLKSKGQQVSITPRSWMNGTYYKKFRQSMQATTALMQVHTFESRSKVFRDTHVLQESVIVRLDKDSQTPTVTIAISEDHTSQISTRKLPYDSVCTGDFIFVPATDADIRAITWMRPVKHTLEDLGLSISTGKVVDFRQRHNLVSKKTSSSYPMVYSRHLSQGTVVHPVENFSKPQWFEVLDTKDVKSLVPEGTYVLVKRFSAKEEKRRISSALFQPSTPVAFDNKTNYFHIDGRGLPLAIARGLNAWLNSDQVDAYFRVFSGHTQVNATDLRQMKFPSTEQLKQLGLGNITIDSLGEQL